MKIPCRRQLAALLEGGQAHSSFDEAIGRQTLLPETLLIADHTAFRLGDIILRHRLLGIWK